MAVPKNKRYRQIVRARRTLKIINKINAILAKNTPIKKYKTFTNLNTASNLPKHSKMVFGSAQSVCYACVSRDLANNTNKQLKHLSTFDKIGSVPTLCKYCFNLYSKGRSIVSLISKINDDLQQRRNNDEDWCVNMHIYQYPLDGVLFEHGVHFKPLLMAEIEPEMHDLHHAASILDIFKGHMGDMYSQPLRTCYLTRHWDGYGYAPKRLGVKKSSLKKINKKKYKKFIC